MRRLILVSGILVSLLLLFYACVLSRPQNVQSLSDGTRLILRGVTCGSDIHSLSPSQYTVGDMVDRAFPRLRENRRRTSFRASREGIAFWLMRLPRQRSQATLRAYASDELGHHYSPIVEAGSDVLFVPASRAWGKKITLRVFAPDIKSTAVQCAIFETENAFYNPKLHQMKVFAPFTTETEKVSVNVLDCFSSGSLTEAPYTILRLEINDRRTSEAQWYGGFALATFNEDSEANAESIPFYSVYLGGEVSFQTASQLWPGTWKFDVTLFNQQIHPDRQFVIPQIAVMPGTQLYRFTTGTLNGKIIDLPSTAVCSLSYDPADNQTVLHATARFSRANQISNELQTDLINLTDQDGRSLDLRHVSADNSQMHQATITSSTKSVNLHVQIFEKERIYFSSAIRPLENPFTRAVK